MMMMMMTTMMLMLMMMMTMMMMMVMVMAMMMMMMMPICIYAATPQRYAFKFGKGVFVWELKVAEFRSITRAPLKWPLGCVLLPAASRPTSTLALLLQHTVILILVFEIKSLRR